MKIVSWNVNSVRIRFESFIKIDKILRPDVICLQETKVIDESFPYDFFKNLGYKYINFCGEKSYNGVAIISKFPTQNICYYKLAGKHDCRHISAVINDIEIHNFYVPAGGDEPDPIINSKFAHKLEYLDDMKNWFLYNRTQNCKMVLVGDLNVAPGEHDVWSHKQLSKIVSHTPIEIDKLNNLKASLNWCDTHREFIDNSQKLYSWWSYRNKDWQKSNRGRRLDHIWISNNLKPYLESAKILKEARSWSSPSDHVPIYINLDL